RQTKASFGTAISSSSKNDSPSDNRSTLERASFKDGSFKRGHQFKGLRSKRSFDRVQKGSLQRFHGNGPDHESSGSGNVPEDPNCNSIRSSHERRASSTERRAAGGHGG